MQGITVSSDWSEILRTEFACIAVEWHMKQYFEKLNISTRAAPEFIDLNQAINAILKKSGVVNGIVCVSGNHTTTAITINENETRLLLDIEHFLETLAPSKGRYLHNDIHLRDCPPDEPENAHAHLIAMMFGNSESLPVQDGQAVLGKWQSLFLVELDGPRDRTVNVQVIGE